MISNLYMKNIIAGLIFRRKTKTDIYGHTAHTAQ